MLISATAHGASFPSGTSGAVSKYGLIQNVQNYSSNPFWDPSGPYNQRMPQPVYANGADLNTGDCQRAVASLVASFCASNNNCIGMNISDIRPTVMTQLSKLPGHNYASACAGFIDTEFTSYKSKYSTAAPTSGYTTFPSATQANPNAQPTSEFKIENPYAPKPTQWMLEMLERKNELDELQSQNGAGNNKLAHADFPTTAADYSFAERMNNLTQGYAPFKDASAYQKINIESAEDYMTRRANIANMQQAFCAKRYGTNLDILNSDLGTVKKCKANKTPIQNCKTQGTYF